ncbi:MAG: hypothetical protein ABFC71_09545 [Methanoregula sp.]
MTFQDNDDRRLQIGSPSRGMDVDAELKIWIKTVKKFLLIRPK